jgi:hypothetical protein
MQDRAAIAPGVHALAIEQMSVDAGHLRRRVRAQPEVRPDSWSTSLKVLQVEFRPVPESSDSRCSTSGGITSS